MPIVDRLWYTLGLDSRGYNKSAAKADAQTKKLSKSIGTGLTRAVKTAAAAYLGVHGLRMAINSTLKPMMKFEEEMAQVNTLIGRNEKTMKMLNEGILEIAKTSSKSLSDLTKSMYDLISAGVDTENVLYALNKAQMAATAGGTSIENATRGAMATINAFGLSISDLGRILDMEFNTIKYGVLNLGQFANAIGQVLKPAKILGATLEEVHAGFAMITKAGRTADESATILQRTFLQLAMPATIANFEKLGIAMHDKVTGEFVGFIEVLKQLEKKLEGVSDKQRSDIMGVLGLQSRAVQGITIMTEGLKEYQEITAEMAETGAMQEAYDIMFETLGVQWKNITAIAKASMVEWTQDNKQFVEDMINGLRLIAEALPEILNVSKTTFKGVWKMGNHVVKSLALEFRALAILITGVFGAAAMFFDRRLMEASLSALQDHIKEFNKLLEEDADILAGMPDAIFDIAGSFDKLIARVKELGKESKKVVLDFAVKAGEVEGAVAGVGRPAMGLGLPSRIIRPDIEIRDMTRRFWDYVKLAFDDGLDFLKGAFEGIRYHLNSLANDVIDIFQGIFSGNWLQVGYSLVGMMFDLFGSDDSAAIEATRNLEALERQFEQTISAIERTTISERERRLAILRSVVAAGEGVSSLEDLTYYWSLLKEAGYDITSWEGFWEALRLARAEVEALSASLLDFATIRGIDNFREAVDYLLGIEDVTLAEGQRLIDYWANMFDLTAEQQIELYDILGELIENAGGWTTDAWMRWMEIMDRLKEERDEVIRPRPDIGTDIASQTYRSITTITESQANILVAVLNTIRAEVQSILDVLTGIAQSISGGLGGAVYNVGGITFNITGSNGNEIADSVVTELRGLGMRAG